MKKIFWILLIMAAGQMANAQLGFQFIPELHGRNLDGLFQVKLVNPGAEIRNVNLTIKITARGQGEVVKLMVRNMNVQQGITSITPAQASRAQVFFAQSSLARMVRQSNLLPEAEYEYCFLVEEADKPVSSVVAQECFSYRMEALSPLSLIEPYNGQDICEKRPMLVWQPVLPAIDGMAYQVTLCEVRSGQTPTEALFYNIPLVNQKSITSPLLPYPAIARDLDTGKKYVWQVTAYRSDMILSRSEIWTFRLKCGEEAAPVPVGGYRNIEDLVKGNYYIAEGRILFAIDNPYTEMKLDYSIECLTDPDMKMKRIPEVKLSRGRNNVTIELDGPSFKDGYSYVMKVKTPGGLERKMRFVYKSNVKE